MFKILLKKILEFEYINKYNNIYLKQILFNIKIKLITKPKNYKNLLVNLFKLNYYLNLFIKIFYIINLNNTTIVLLKFEYFNKLLLINNNSVIFKNIKLKIFKNYIKLIH